MDHFKNPFDNFDTNQKLNILIEIDPELNQAKVIETI